MGEALHHRPVGGLCRGPASPGSRNASKDGEQWKLARGLPCVHCDVGFFSFFPFSVVYFIM